MKHGVAIKIDVSKIDKAHLYKGQKGTYLDAVVFIDTDEKDQNGNSGMIVQDWKDAPKGQTPILGNVRIFWSGNQANQQQGQRQQGSNQAPKTGTQHQQSSQQGSPDMGFDDSVPF